MASKSDFEVILGTYEEFLVGYRYEHETQTLTQSFAAHDHTSSIRSLDQSKQLVASGGADDRIHIYDMKTRQERYMLSHHTSTINCLQFTKDQSHLITGTADGTISIVKIGSWQVEKLWEKAHKGAAILDIAIHPTGKLMLSLAADCSLRTWNLIKGRQAYVVNLNSKSKDPKSLQRIVWSPNGDRFALFGGKYLEIWSIETGGILLCVENSSKVVSGIWVKEKKIVVGYENGQLGIVNTESGNVKTVEAHQSRVRGLQKLNKWYVTASSGGEIKIWDNKFNELAKGDCGCRITCLCLIDTIDVKTEEIDKEEGSVVEQTDLVVKKKKQKHITNDESIVIKKKKTKK